MSKLFNETDRDRCMHCGKWKPQCSLSTLDVEIEHYGDYAICSTCYKSHNNDYWKEWVKKRREKSK